MFGENRDTGAESRVGVFEALSRGGLVEVHGALVLAERPTRTAVLGVSMRDSEEPRRSMGEVGMCL